MQNQFSPWKATFLWLHKRFKQIRSTKYGRVGLVFAFVVVLFLIQTQLLHAAPPAASLDIIDRIVLYIAELALNIAIALSRLTVHFINVLIPVMLYNDFANNPIVSAGWAVVRDAVNMFFVIVLVVIAFGTIFGHSKFKWQQQVPKLLIFALVINFSKTLSGIMIDFGQVVMLTFANALKQVAAGNFVQMFGFTKIYTMSTNNQIVKDAVSAAGTGPGPFDFFLTGIASVMMMAWVLMIMLILLGVLLYRIIMLWILIVISPLAWFVGGAGDIISGGAYAEWWKRFKCFVAVGPVLTFFLWLTLTIAGAGNLAAGFDTAGDAELANPANFLSELFELQHFLSFIIAMAMIVAGMDAAKQVCSGVPGKIGDALGGKWAAGIKGISKKVAGKGMGFAYKKGVKPIIRELGRGVEKVPLLNIATKKGRADVLARGGRVLSKTRFARGLGVSMMKGAAKTRESIREEVATAGKSFEGLSTEDAVATASAYASKGAFTRTGQNEGAALLQRAMKDKDFATKLRDAGALKGLYKNFGSHLGSRIKGDTDSMQSFEDFKIRNADITGSYGQITTKEEVAEMDERALMDENVKNQMRSIKSGVRESRTVTDANGNAVLDKNGNELKEVITLSMYDAMAQGHFGEEKRAAITQDEGAVLTKVDDGRLRGTSNANLAGAISSAKDPAILAERAITLAIKDGDVKRANMISQTLLSKYSETDDESQRANIATALDRVAASLNTLSTSKDINRGQRNKAQTLLSQLNNNRQNVQAEKGFGRIPLAHERAQGVTVEEHAENILGKASATRAGKAGDQVARQINDLLAARDAKLGELNIDVSQSGLQGPQAEELKKLVQVNKELTESIIRLGAKINERRNGLKKEADKEVQPQKRQVKLLQANLAKETDITKRGEIENKIKAIQKIIKSIYDSKEQDDGLQSLLADLTSASNQYTNTKQGIQEVSADKIELPDVKTMPEVIALNNQIAEAERFLKKINELYKDKDIQEAMNKRS